MSTFAEHVKQTESRRDPPYRPAMYLDEDEKRDLAEKIGDASLYQDLFTMREMVRHQPDNIELKKALVSGIASAEFAGIDAFSRKVVEWQDWDVPPTLIMAIARQTWDEVRHANLAKGLIESYGGKIGDYPDTLAGGGPPPGAQQQQGTMQQGYASMPENLMRDPVVSLSMTNVSLEGGALTLFQETSKVGEKIGDGLMAHCYDYNWADEVTHTAIGDFFVKELTEDNPEAEAKALKVHALAEVFRTRLSGQQSEELREFFADEMVRANAALGAAAS
ncbi:MAG TPA: hypothetical protein VFY79_08675 [Dehalococcoidia bacterium]|nr:hypothetical protein [Dehalococcoidia bacterium]